MSSTLLRAVENEHSDLGGRHAFVTSFINGRVALTVADSRTTKRADK